MNFDIYFLGKPSLRCARIFFSTSTEPPCRDCQLNFRMSDFSFKRYNYLAPLWAQFLKPLIGRYLSFIGTWLLLALLLKHLTLWWRVFGKISFTWSYPRWESHLQSLWHIFQKIFWLPLYLYYQRHIRRLLPYLHLPHDKRFSRYRQLSGTFHLTKGTSI